MSGFFYGKTEKENSTIQIRSTAVQMVEDTKRLKEKRDAVVTYFLMVIVINVVLALPFILAGASK